MIFPETRRIIYSKNPLDEVICQLRFPPILRIEKEIPYEFQDKIRAVFPEYLEREEKQIPIPGQDLENVPAELFGLARNISSRRNYSFLSEDKKWKINITREFISISTINYSRWEVFREKLIPAMEYFVEIYKPSFYSRIGLRYIDVIRRSLLNLSDVNWSELLQPSIIGILGNTALENQIEEMVSNTILDLGENNAKVRIQNGLITLEKDEKGYLVDSDFYVNEKTNITDALEKLNYFHECASRLIRWCITERLHNAMEPQEL